MRTVNIHEAKTQLSRLADAAAGGEGFVIAKAGWCDAGSGRQDVAEQAGAVSKGGSMHPAVAEPESSRPSAQQPGDVAAAVQDADDVEVIDPLEVEQQIREAADRPGTEAGRATSCRNAPDAGCARRCTNARSSAATKASATASPASTA
jgi:hypothetical protein